MKSCSKSFNCCRLWFVWWDLINGGIIRVNCGKTKLIIARAETRKLEKINLYINIGKKGPSYSTKDQGAVLILFVLSHQQSKTCRYSVYNHIGQRKAANAHILGAGTREFLALLLEKINRFSVDTLSDSAFTHFSYMCNCFDNQFKQFFKHKCHINQFQLKCCCFSLLIDCELNILGFRIAGQTKQAVWRRHLGLQEIVICIFICLTVCQLVPASHHWSYVMLTLSERLNCKPSWF